MSVLIFPLAMPSEIFHQINSHLGEANAGEPRAVRVWIFVRTDEQLVGLAVARNRITDCAQLGFQFGNQPKLFVRLASRSDDCHRARRSFL